MSVGSRVVAGALAVLAAWQVGRPGDAPSAPGAAERRVQASRPATGTGMFRGMAVQLHDGRDVYERYHRLIPEVRELGAETILFVVHGYQEHAGSLDLHLHPDKTAEAKELGRLLDDARSNGLRTILMPMVLLLHPRNNEWRGQIVPNNKNWDAWFDRYTEFLVHFARIAERHEVAVFMVGSELIKAEDKTERWRRTIAEVRRHYRGKLGYSANWDHYQTEKIGFWPDLDVVGMTTYYKLADGPNPKLEEVERNWGKFKKEILAFQREINRPILFTEVGWCSQEGAAKEAWNYYQNQKATEAGLREQAVCYQAFLNVWEDEPCVAGIVWWEWDNTPGGREDYNYTPRGKPAEKILREWFARERDPSRSTLLKQPHEPAGHTPG